MKNRKEIKISLSTFFLVLSLIVIIVMGIFIYRFYNEKTEATKKSAELQAQINILSRTVSDLQGKVNSVPESINSDKTDKNEITTKDPTQNNDDITYTISTKDEIYATIKATKNGKTVSKEFEMGAMIADTGTIKLPTIGTVALVADTGGEYYGVNIYQLVNDEIKLIGTMDCGADMVKEATYTVETKNATTAIINAKINNENITKEFEMSSTITNTSVVDILKCGKVVLVTEARGEYYIIQAYRLSQDYITGETKEIKNVGSIQHNI